MAAFRCDGRFSAKVGDSFGSVPAVRHYYKLTLALLPASVGAAVYWGLRYGVRDAERCLLRRESQS